MHPPEDVSLEEIRARRPKYLKKITTAIANAISYSSTHATQKLQSSLLQQQHQQQQNLLSAQSAAIASAAAAHEVSSSNLQFFI